MGTGGESKKHKNSQLGNRRGSVLLFGPITPDLSSVFSPVQSLAHVLFLPASLPVPLLHQMSPILTYSQHVPESKTRQIQQTRRVTAVPLYAQFMTRCSCCHTCHRSLWSLWLVQKVVVCFFRQKQRVSTVGLSETRRSVMPLFSHSRRSPLLVNLLSQARLVAVFCLLCLFCKVNCMDFSICCQRLRHARQKTQWGSNRQSERRIIPGFPLRVE